MNEIISKTADYVKEKLYGESSGHDWWHTQRVWKNSIEITKEESANLFVIQLAALLHDIADWKLHDGNENLGPETAREWLEKLNVDKKIIQDVCEIIKDISFKGSSVKSKMKTKEGMIVQDADRLDALGAVGIARTFAYSGKMGREIHNPNVKPQENQTFEQYKNDKSTGINHFYEKLLLLKDLMNTETAKKIAGKRHKFMESFLKEFYKEWGE